MDMFDRLLIVVAMLLIAAMGVINICRSNVIDDRLATQSELNDSTLKRIIFLEEELHKRTMELKTTMEDNGIQPLTPSRKQRIGDRR